MNAYILIGYVLGCLFCFICGVATGLHEGKHRGEQKAWREYREIVGKAHFRVMEELNEAKEEEKLLKAELRKNVRLIKEKTLRIEESKIQLEKQKEENKECQEN